MKIVVKVSLFGLGTVVILGLMAVGGMPGARHVEKHLAGDYYFSHSVGFQSSITEERDWRSRFVIDTKVEEFIVHDNGIFVTRRPVLREGAGANRVNYRLADTCEYYRIDVAERKVYGPFTLAEVKNRDEWTFFKQRQANDDFGVTMCKLGALRD